MSDQTPGDVPELGPLPPDLAEWFAAQGRPSMPPDVWARIEAALGAEQPLAPAAAAALAPVVPLASSAAAAKRSLAARAWPILGAAAGLVLIGIVVLPVIRGGGDQPVTVADGGAVVSTTASAVAQETPTALVGSGSPSKEASHQSRHANVPMAVLSTGTDYTMDSMPQQVGVLLTTAGIKAPQDIPALPATDDTAAPTPSPVGDSGFTATPQTLVDCLERLGADAQELPALIVDRATFAGSDAAVVVMMKSSDQPVSDEPAVLDVVVVGAMCTDADVASAQHFDYQMAP